MKGRVEIVTLTSAPRVFSTQWHPVSPESAGDGPILAASTAAGASPEFPARAL